LLDAALACLAERGYAGTSIGEVLRRADLSNGALWRHFRSKAELMTAAALHSEERLAAWPSLAGLETLSADERLDRTVAHLWRWTHDPAFQALLELLHASRSDPEVAAALTATDRTAGEIFFDAFARMVGPEITAHPHFRRNARLLALTLYGSGLTYGLRSRAGEERLLAEVKSVVQLLFAPTSD
jgi:AcrR family transcriptional regulator